MASSDIVLLTGSTGHVGYGVLKELLKHGHTVRAAVRSQAKADVVRNHPSTKAKDGQLSFAIVPDFLVDGAFDEAAKGVKYVVHVASPIPSPSQAGSDLHALIVEPAIKGTLGMFESARKSGTVKRVVVTSSAIATIPMSMFMGQDEGTTMYGPDYRADNFEPPYMDNPQVAYAASKIAALKEAEAWVKREKPGFDAIHIHPSFVHGRDDLTTSLESFESGTNMMALVPVLGRTDDILPSAVVHLDDVAMAHVRALDPTVPGNQSFLLTSSGKDGMQWDDVKEYAKKHFPDAVEKGVLKNDGTRPTGKCWLDNSKTKEVLGIEGKSFEDMIVSVLGHYLELYEKEKGAAK